MLGFIARNPKYAITNVRDLPAVRKAMNEYHADNPNCAWCDRATDVDTHHVKPVQRFPDLAADKNNMISLCRQPQCHCVVGHHGDFTTINMQVRECCTVNKYMPLKLWIEIDPRESGKTWIVKETRTVMSRDGKLFTKHAGHRCDRYSLVPNCKDNEPAEVHDEAGETRTWDNGEPMTWREWNDLLKFRMEQSWDADTRSLASLYGNGVPFLDWPIWLWRKWTW